MNVNYGLPSPDVNLRSSKGGFVAAKKKSQKKASKKSSSTSTPRLLTKKQYQAHHADIIKDIERLEADLNLDLKELKGKLDFCLHPFKCE
jgi:hypothetical protein